MARRKRKKLKTSAILIVLILIGGLIIGSYFAIKHFSGNEASNTPNVDEKLENKPDEKKEENYKVSLLATGDGLVHNVVAQWAKTSNGYDFKPYLSEVKDYVNEFDIAYYNQETPFGTNESNYSYYPTFSVPTAYGDAMLDAGFNLISLASNHSYDKGEVGVLRSLDYWKTKDNIIYNGIASSEEERKNYQIGEKNNITYAMISYTYGLNGFSLPKGKDYLVTVFDEEKAHEDIAYLKDKVDVIIVAMHWGVEYQLSPTNTQIEQAKWLANEGVDIVIGNHPHCIQPIEWIDDTLVIYSLGNFISNQIDLYSSIGYKGAVGAFAMVDINKKIDKDDEVTISVDNLKVDLIYTYKDRNKKTYRVVPFSKMTDDTYLPNHTKVYEDYAKVIKAKDSNIKVLPTN